MALRSTQSLTEMSTRNLHGARGRPARKAEIVTATCKPIVYNMREARCLTTLLASTACYRDGFIFYLYSKYIMGWMIAELEGSKIFPFVTVTRRKLRSTHFLSNCIPGAALSK
jgi:hypothetical protein